MVYLKWAGGKRRISDKVREQLGGPCTGTYHEPFVGSGAVFFDRVAKGEITTAVLSDTNAALISCHEAVRDHPIEVIAVLFDGSRHPTGEEWKDRYNTLRAEYNDMRPGTVEHAARFIWLNRACFNGLYRVNKSGKFNVPVGSYRTIKLPDPDVIASASEALKCAVLHTWSFERSMAMVPWGKNQGTDQVYCDPPYVPKSATANFTAYTKGGFDWACQVSLAKSAREASDRGARVVLSNHDLPMVRDLYDGFEITSLQAKRSISAKKSSRGSVSELLVSRGPLP